jgi:hypothetical protein
MGVERNLTGAGWKPKMLAAGIARVLKVVEVGTTKNLT